MTSPTHVLTEYLGTYMPRTALIDNTHSSGMAGEQCLPLGEGVLAAEAQEGYPGVDILFPNRALSFGSATLPLYRQGKARPAFGLPSHAVRRAAPSGWLPEVVSGCPTTSKDVYLCPPKSRCTIALTFIGAGKTGWLHVRAEVPYGASVLSFPEPSEHTPGHYQCQEKPLTDKGFSFPRVFHKDIHTCVLTHNRHTHQLP